VTRTVDGHAYHLMLTDTAGQEEYRGLWASSNLSSDAFLLVYDITSPPSLAALDHFNALIDMEAETRLDAGRTAPVKIVAANKCDLQSARQVSAQVGLEWARRNGCGFMETSAREMVNVEETFALLVRRVVEARKRGAGGVQWGAVDTVPAAREKEGRGREAGGDHDEGAKRGFWRRFACW
jgi:GTPase KRas protein